MLQACTGAHAPLSTSVLAGLLHAWLGTCRPAAAPSAQLHGARLSHAAAAAAPRRRRRGQEHAVQDPSQLCGALRLGAHLCGHGHWAGQHHRARLHSGDARWAGAVLCAALGVGRRPGACVPATQPAGLAAPRGTSWRLELSRPGSFPSGLNRRDTGTAVPAASCAPAKPPNVCAAAPCAPPAWALQWRRRLTLRTGCRWMRPWCFTRGRPRPRVGRGHSRGRRRAMPAGLQGCKLPPGPCRATLSRACCGCQTLGGFDPGP